MLHRPLISLLLAVVAIAGTRFAAPGQARDQAPGQAPGQSPEDPSASGDLAWLEGHWIGEGFGGVVEEVWLPARDGVMLGVFRHHADGEATFFELVTIGERDGELAMTLKHFHPDLKGWEEKDESLVWPASEASDDRIRFGPVLYELEGDDTLIASVELGGTKPDRLVFKRVGPEERPR